MYKCEYCGSMDLVQKEWASVNKQSLRRAEVILEEPMWCNSCEEHTEAIELPVVTYTYKVDIFEMQNGELVKLKEKMVFKVGANENTFWYESPLKFTEVSEDGHYLHFKKWIAKDVCQMVYIACFPKIDLTNHKDAVEEFFNKEPDIDVRVNEVVDIVEGDRVTGTMPIRIDYYREE